MPRRRDQSLTVIELEILSAGAAAAAHGQSEFHGFGAAKALAAAGDGRRLTATGTMYRALHRLEEFGLLQSRWEEPDAEGTRGRPARKLYRLTTAGEAALARVASPSPSRRAERLDKPGAQPS